MHFDTLLRCRRLYRKQILKKKRELGLINIANSKVIRYKQKQTTAMQKNRCNGKFASVVFCLVETFELKEMIIPSLWIVTSDT